MPSIAVLRGTDGVGEADPEAVHEALMACSSANEGDDYEAMLALTEELQSAFDRADRIPVEAQGWTHYYRFQALYQLDRDDEAYALACRYMDSDWRVPHTAKGWSFSVAAELACRRGDANAAVRWGRACLHERRADDDEASAVQCARTLCELLAGIERSDQNTPFACFLIELGTSIKVAELICDGYQALWANAQQSGDHHRRWLLIAGLPLLDACGEVAGFEGRASALTDAIRGADWFPSDAAMAASEALLVAASNGDGDALRAALNGADLHACSSQGLTALALAICTGHLDLATALLDHGAPFETTNLAGHTPVSHAADENHHELLARLLAAGAAVDPVDANGQTPLFLTAWQGHIPAMKVLLAHGADPSVRDRVGNTPLHMAAREGQLEAARALVEGGADIDAPTTSERQTPLMRAAMEGRGDVVELLLASGARTDRIDAYDLSAADWAEREGLADLAARLASPR